MKTNARGHALGIYLMAAVSILADGEKTPGAPVDESRIKDLGARVFGSTTHAAVFDPDDRGWAKVYILQDGALDGGKHPSKLIVADVNTGRVERALVIPGGEGGWGIAVARDHSVYAGVYRSGHVYRLVPGESVLTDLGQALPGQGFLYGLCAGEEDGILGGTFPGAQVFSYSPGRGFSQVGSSPILRGEGFAPSYVRTVAYDSEKRVIYAGLGPGSRLARYELNSGNVTQILPDEFSHTDFVYGATVVHSKVLVRLLSSEQGIALEVTDDGQATLDATFPMSGLSFSGEDAGHNVYYTQKRWLTAYNLQTKRTRTVGRQPWPANSYATAIVKLDDQEKFPGFAAVGICNYGGRIWLAKTCLSTGHTTATPIDVAPVAQTISSIVAGPDGKIYASGYLTGGTGVYDPRDPAGNFPTLYGVAQCEGMTAVGGKIYFGGYPGAYLYEFDPGRPWQEGLNPRVIFNLAEFSQDRPFAMGSDGSQQVLMGTVPEYGHLGGALTIYNIHSGARRTWLAAELGIEDLSILSCTWLNGVVYAGTSISGGIGAQPTQTRAKFLGYSPATGKAIAYELPDSIPNQKVISAVTVGPDRKVWMMVEGWLVIFDPATGTFEHQANLFPEVRHAPTASATVVHDATLLTARDGWVYGTIRGRILFKIDPVSRAMTVISATEGGSHLVEGPGGEFYYVRGVSLFRHEG